MDFHHGTLVRGPNGTAQLRHGGTSFNRSTASLMGLGGRFRLWIPL
jgi:hypothetical protein